MVKYNHKTIEKKWQGFWDKNKVFEVKEDNTKKKFYGLIEFPYPSGDGLHTGHLRSNTAMDIICRQRRMAGYNVLYPIGFDAFGLPAENYAIKVGVKPQISIAKNIKTFTKQLKESGFSFDWSRVFSTTDPEYYKWTQWIFVQLFKQGLAYKKKENINWCISCKIGLANEEVVNGACERCGGEVVMKEKEQWLLKITKYADRLIDDLDKVDYLERIKTQQINWIGKSVGAEVRFKITTPARSADLATPPSKGGDYLPVFTTRPDTLFGATFMVIAPEHELISKIKNQLTNYLEVEEYINQVKKKTTLERVDLNKEKTGVELKGIKAINPVAGKEIPIWVADYVMMGYGTGAIMAVPGHDGRDYEFARKYGLPVIEVVKPINNQELRIKNQKLRECFEGEGMAINSGEFNGLTTREFKEKMTRWLEKKGLGKKTVNYKLRDWIFSRQRYWGEPIPMINCEKCGWVAVAEKDLPVELPDIDDFMPTDEGDSPLAKIESFVKVQCPQCGGKAKRETDVMPNWAGSNWYFLRYTDPKNKKTLAAPEKLKHWTPVDWYNGGMEHTTLHLLYSRFIYKFLYDIGAVPKECGAEPYKKRTAHGMILGEGGAKMSKSKGNVINPDNYIKKYGADTLRVYEMFMGPFDAAIIWEDKSVVGVRRFLDKVWKLQEKCSEQLTRPPRFARMAGMAGNRELTRLVHQSIKKVGEDIEKMRFNTAVSQLMILVNEMEKEEEIPVDDFKILVLLLSPFAPHMAEELWQMLGNKKTITYEPWPKYDESLLKEEEIELVVQVNGKVRDKIKVLADITEDEAKSKALESEKIQKWLDGRAPKKVIYIKGKLVSVVV